ncbi:SDR family oxidoreductase [Salinarimonas sp. NSM]|uniref:SDR family oxidoreductase n=1 Tax=Salinarimonas sp. NSM TaxID=3458003 RepID=UPI0040352994
MRGGLENMRGRVVMLTGASAGIGRATALRLAHEGARIGLLARSPEALDDVAREVRARGGEALALPCDVADADGVFRAADALEREFGPIDVWINDAMVTVFSPVHEMTPDEYRRVTEVTYLGAVHGTLAALRTMRPRGRGIVVQVGSALAYRGIPLQSAYCGAKHAIVGFSDSLRAELRHDDVDIAVTEVHLPGVNTPQFEWARSRMERAPRPSGPVYQPEAAADAIVHAIRSPERAWWLGGVTAMAIIGNALAPGLADRYLGANAVEGQMREGRTRRPVPPAGNLYRPAERALHRTHGPFGREAKASAMRLPGPQTRIGAAVATAAVAAGIGLAIGRIARR